MLWTKENIEEKAGSPEKGEALKFSQGPFLQEYIFKLTLPSRLGL